MLLRNDRRLTTRSKFPHIGDVPLSHDEVFVSRSALNLAQIDRSLQRLNTCLAGNYRHQLIVDDDLL